MLKKSILFGTSAVLTVALAAPAMAQTADEDIIYTTATKRQTTLQETPVAVAVTSAATIEKANIDDISDLQSVVPSLRVNTLQSSQNTNFIIRGFGNGANNAGIEPSVGVFVDGVYRSRSAASIGDLPNLQRVEVLNGPQSTLFGKNASAGVISVVTSKPQFETQGYYELGIGNYDAFTAKGYVTGAVGGSDNVAYSLGAGLSKRDGYVRSAIGLDDVNDRDRFNVRGQLLMEVTDRVTARLIADFSTIDENCCHVSNFTIGDATPAIGAVDGDFTDQDLADARNPYAYVAYQNTDSLNEVRDGGLSAHIDVAFDNFDLTSITSYRANDSYYLTDADYSLNRSLEVGSDQKLSTFTQEVRLTSNTTEGNIDWMVGGFLFNENVDQVGSLMYGEDLRTYIDFLVGNPATLAGIQGLYPGSAPFFGDQIETQENFTQDNLAISLFGTVDFHVNDRLTLTGGLNYTQDEKDVTGSTTNNDSFSAIDFDTTPTVFGISFVDLQVLTTLNQAPTQANLTALQTGNPALYGAVVAGVNTAIQGLRGLQFQPQFLAFPNVLEDGNTNDDKITYSLRAAYEIDDSLNVYASHATGFKSSSWNLSRDSRPFGPTAAEQAPFNPIALANQSFGTRFAAPEFATVWEIGLKKSFDRGYFNAAAFTQSIEDFQGNTFVGTSFTLTNAGETQVNGVEFDSSFDVTENFNLKVAATLLDPEYSEFRNAPGCVPGSVEDLTGKTPGNVSDISASVAGTYNHEFANGMNGYLRGDYQYESEANYGNTVSSDCYTQRGITSYQAPNYDQRQQDLVNLSAGLNFENGLGIQVWGRNVFSDEYAGSIFPGVAQQGIINGYPSQPATYGVNLRQKF